MWPFKSTPNPKLEALKERYHSLVPRMFEPIEKDTEHPIKLVTLVQPILENEKGRMAIVVDWAYRSMAVHEINQDGTFSKRLPYWTNRYNWKMGDAENGRYALITMAVPKNRGGFKTSNRDSNSTVVRIGVEIKQMDTHFLPKWSWEEFERMHYFKNPGYLK